MSERLTNTTHGDAPLSAALSPDARAADLGASEADDELVARTFTINLPLDEVYDFVKEPGNLAQLAGEAGLPWSTLTLEGGPQQASRPRVGTASGDRAGEGSSAASARLSLRPAPAHRGTEVTITLASEARGFLKRAADKLSGDDPRILSRRVLRRLKQLLETGEIATTAPGGAAPRG